MTLRALKFEIFGKVQKVYFRKHTQEEAQRLGLVGWVQNTPQGTVVGEVEGPLGEVEKMKTWLSTTGSPASIIENAQFSDERDIDSLSFTGFEFRR